LRNAAEATTLDDERGVIATGVSSSEAYSSIRDDGVCVVRADDDDDDDDEAVEAAMAAFFDKTVAFLCIVSVTILRMSVFVVSGDIIIGSIRLPTGRECGSNLGCDCTDNLPASDVDASESETNKTVGFSVFILSL
jgi:hypothetical protein